MMRKICLISALILFLTCHAAGAEYRELTYECRFTAVLRSNEVRRVTDENYGRIWNGKGDVMSVRLPAGEHARGIQLSFFRNAVPVVVEALDASGAVTGEAVYEDRFLNAYIPLACDGTYHIRASDPAADLRLNRVQVFAGDEIHPDAQTWQEPEGAMDLLQIVTHPDDDLIWFGGLLPTYAGERHMKVLVAYAATRGALPAGRFNELLDGLWTCGVRLYPEFGPFADFHAQSVPMVTSRWGAGAAEAWCTGLIRHYRPKVVVTQDLRGESGHVQHKALAQAVVDTVTEWAGNADRDPESAAAYGLYTPQKLYIHRYRQHEIFMDWDRPLSAFNGKTGAQVAREAFHKHVSQRKTHYRIYMSGPMDSRYLGLYFSAVGEDADKNDLFEHVALTPEVQPKQ